MELLELELYGFKSFAKRTKIKFNSGITGIVGPNGSGKSNIVDAIMWTLGEQSAKQLRGQKMEDVIFTGTQSRPALGFAEVSLLFDNSDKYLDINYDQVSIRRKFFRSGESEYYINNQRVRLKDIRELFMDTGIGKDGYSFIGQGQVEQILSNRPQDRRAVFEEAAGIIKFKTRKDESIKSLEKTEDNLQRLEDILQEITAQEAHLNQEKIKLDEFKTLDSQREVLEAKLLHLDIQKTQNITFKKKQLIEGLEQEKKEAQVQLSEKKNLIQNLKREVNEKNKVLDQLTDSKLDILQKKERLNSTYNHSHEDSERLVRENNELKDEKIKLEQSLEHIVQIKADDENNIIKLNEQLETLESEFKIVQDKYDDSTKKLKSIKSIVQTKEANEMDRVSKSSQIRSRIEALDYLINQREERLEALKLQEEKLEEQSKIYLKEINSRETQASDYKDQLDSLKDLIEDLKSEYNQESLNYKNAHKDYKKLEEEFVELTREIKFLTRVQENHEGYSNAVKNFLKIVKNMPNLNQEIIGPVADVIEIKPGFELAISTALGGSAQHIIIATDHRIGEMIKLLKNKKLGRATFLPLTTMNYYPIHKHQIPKVNYNVAIASELVNYNSNLTPVIKNLLGRILVVETLEQGRDLSARINRKFRIVTKSGDVFNVGGSITGGYQRSNRTDLFNRQRDLQEKQGQEVVLKEKLNKFMEHISDLEQNLGKIQEKIEAKQLDQSELHEKNIRLGELILRLKDSHSKENQRLEDTQSAIQEEEQSIVLHREEYNELKDNISSIEIIDTEKLTELREKSKKIEEIHETLQEKKTECQLEISNLKSDIREIEISNRHRENEEQNLVTRCEAIKLEMREHEQQILNLKALINETQEAIEREQQTLDTIEGQREDLRLEIGTCESEIETVEEAQEKLDQTLLNIEGRRERQNVLLENSEQELMSLQAQLNKLEEKYRDPGILNTEDKRSPLKAQLKSLNKDILKLGNINMNAAKEHKEVAQRLKFNLEQKEDLCLSKEKLEQVVDELEREMRSVFKGAIQEIQVYFNEIFQTLFQGGKASIELEDPEHVLESGIEIKAQPPGKKLQSLTLLSGGERSMTAVALLFALLKKRSSPFCILDEIDASLDEANILRYTKYLSTLEDMQFIIITHRKTTMEIASRLYGITMEEEGVSTVLSLELEEVEDARVAKEKI